MWTPLEWELCLSYSNHILSIKKNARYKVGTQNICSACPGQFSVLPGGPAVWGPGAADKRRELCWLELGSRTQGAQTGFRREDYHDHPGQAL